MTNSKPRYDVETVKAAVSMPAAIARYADPGRGRHRCPCPIHGGKDDNLSFNDSQFHCFVCGAGGDVIKFVMLLFNLSFPDALCKLGEDFGVAQGVDPHAVEKRRADESKRQERIRREQDNFRIFIDFFHELDNYPNLQLKYMFKKSLTATIDDCIANHNAADYDAAGIVGIMRENLNRAMTPPESERRKE